MKKSASTPGVTPISTDTSSETSQLAHSACASALIGDAFTLLCLVNNTDIKPTGAHLLPPTVLKQLAPLLHVSEPNPLGEKRSVQRPWRSERNTQRIRFIHFLCRATGLMHTTCGYIKPTLNTAQWLAATDTQRYRQLVNAFLSAASATLDPAEPALAPGILSLWQTFHMPGWKFPLPTLALRQLVQCLRQSSGWCTFQQAAKRMPIPFDTDDVDASDPQSQPEAVLSELLLFLSWLGVTEEKWQDKGRDKGQDKPNEQCRFRLTALGRQVLAMPGRRATHLHTSAEPLAQQPAKPSVPSVANLVIQPSGEIAFVAHATASLSPLYELSQYAELVSVAPQRQYHLSRARIEHAFERGQSLTVLIGFFERVIGASLPNPVITQLRTWHADFNRVILRRALLIETHDTKTLKQLTSSRGIRPCLGRKLGPRHAIVHEDQLDTLQRRLTWRGLKPQRAYVHAQTNSPTRQKAHATFDQPTLAHLYLSAQLCHHLPDLVPLPYRTPQATLDEVAQQLSQHDLDLVQQWVSQHVEMLHRERRIKQSQPAVNAVWDDEPESNEVLPHALKQLQQATQTGRALQITYHSPNYDGTTTRIIEPQHIEQNDLFTYIIAYCHLARAERTFRLDRIRQITQITPLP
jgi:hypothetical protein